MQPHKYAATIKTIKKEINNDKLDPKTKQRASKYMNNIIELSRIPKDLCQMDHHNIKRITDNMLGFKHFNSACSTIQGIEEMSMIRKGQGNIKTILEEITLNNVIFGVA